MIITIWATPNFFIKITHFIYNTEIQWKLNSYHFQNLLWTKINITSSVKKKCLQSMKNASTSLIHSGNFHWFGSRSARANFVPENFQPFVFQIRIPNFVKIIIIVISVYPECQKRPSTRNLGCFRQTNSQNSRQAVT